MKSQFCTHPHHHIYLYPILDLTRVVTKVIMRSADAMVPCARTRNPEWEVHMGAGSRENSVTSERRSTFSRKVSPVVNGMETDSFKPIHATEEKKPSSCMLSHVYDLKDVKNAILSAAVIVNHFKIKDFQLIIYGSLDKDLPYVEACHGIIASEGLQENVFLCGLGAASKVLPRGWLFLNSSKSEGNFYSHFCFINHTCEKSICLFFLVY